MQCQVLRRVKSKLVEADHKARQNVTTDENKVHCDAINGTPCIALRNDKDNTKVEASRDMCACLVWEALSGTTPAQAWTSTFKPNRYSPPDIQPSTRPCKGLKHFSHATPTKPLIQDDAKQIVQCQILNTTGYHFDSWHIQGAAL